MDNEQSILKDKKRVDEYNNSNDFKVFYDAIMSVDENNKGVYEEQEYDYTPIVDAFKNARKRLIEPYGGWLCGCETSILNDIENKYKIDEETIKGYMDSIKDPILYNPVIMEYIAKCYCGSIKPKNRPKKPKTTPKIIPNFLDFIFVF